MNMQLMAIAVAGLLIGAGYMIVDSQISARVAAENIAVKQKVRADLSQQQIERMEMQLATERERQQELQKQVQAARQRETKSTEVIEDRARLSLLTQAKPGLLERLARKKTAQVWKEIEVESRE